MRYNKTQQVKNYILKNIESGEYRVGHAIESEPTLVKKLGISRVTIRDAIRELAEENILERQHGRGTFVIEQPMFKGFQCGLGFTDEMIRNGMQPSAKHVEVREVPAPAEVVRHLQINPNNMVWNVKRLRLANDHPVALENEYFSKDIVPHLSEEIAQQSIYGYLSSQNIDFSHADQKIDAMPADEELSRMLHVALGEPLIRMYVIAYLKNGTPFNCGTTYYRTDIFKLAQTVYR